MKSSNLRQNNKLTIKQKAKKIKLILTDNDGVLTDTGVYYSLKGEVLKRFSIRDGMGVERLRDIASIKTGIITGELSGIVKKRAEKLGITEIYIGIKEKKKMLPKILKKNNLTADNIAFIGDDMNDLELLKIVGLSASPSDAFLEIREIVDYVCKNKGGNGAFREFAELILKYNRE